MARWNSSSIISSLESCRRNLGNMNCVLMTLILGGFGTYMRSSVFWVCWSLIVIEAIMSNTIPPSIDHAPPGNSTLSAQLQHFGDWLAYWNGFGIKIMLVSIGLGRPLIFYPAQPCTGSRDCEVGSGCYSRLRESLWMMFALYLLEIFFTLPSGGKLFRAAGALSFWPWSAKYRRYTFKTEAWELIRWNSTRSSCVSSSVALAQFVTMGSLVGGSFGAFMTAEVYWLCWCSVIVELIAEGILLIGGLYGNITWIRAKALVMITWTVRFLGQGPVFALMVDTIKRNDYYTTDMSNCDETCRARGRQLIYVCCVATGFQCFSFLTSILTWYVLRGNFLLILSSPDTALFGVLLNVWLLLGYAPLLLGEHVREGILAVFLSNVLGLLLLSIIRYLHSMSARPQVQTPCWNNNQKQTLCWNNIK